MFSQLSTLIMIGATVITTFVVLWWPFLGDWDSTLQVAKRIFPFNRGIFEDKVDSPVNTYILHS